METRLDHYIEKTTLTAVYGVSVKVGGNWRRISDGGVIFLRTREEAEAERGRLRLKQIVNTEGWNEP